MSSSHCNKYQCVYGLLLLFLMTVVNSHPLLNNNVIKDDGNQDYADENPEPVNITLDEISRSMESFDNGTSSNKQHHGSSTTVEKAKKDTGNTTVIIVFVLIVFTIIVKTAPVVISYLLPYFYGPVDKKLEAVNESGENCKEINNTVIMDTKEAEAQQQQHEPHAKGNNNCRETGDSEKIDKKDCTRDTSQHLSESDIKIMANCDNNVVKRTED